MANSPQSHAERRFRDLLEVAPDAIIEVDQMGLIVLLNRVTETMFGYSREELISQPVEILLPVERRGSHAAHRAHYHTSPSTRPMGSSLELEGLRRDGTKFPVEISLSPTGSGSEFRVMAIVRDITERKRTDDRLRSIQERYTRELTASNQELALRNKEVERANRLKSEFLASMSHELRTPLHTIIGFSELLAEQLEGPLNEKQLRFVNHIHKDSLHLLELINDILDLSKIEAGRLELRHEVFDLSPAIEETIASIRPQGQAKSQTLETRSTGSIVLEADRLRVKQILFNLLSNAVKFTPDGGRIRTEARVENEQGVDMAIVSVIDTGIGIAEDEHESVFDKFYQLGATTKGVREGTGLGLAITKRLVEQHGGRIWLQSKPGAGSSFTFSLPMRRPKRTRSS